LETEAKGMTGKFDLKYFLNGKGLEDWFKTWGFGWRLLITLLALIFVAVTIYRAFFMKTQTQKQTNQLLALPFSTVYYAPQQSQKQEVKKRPWWLPIPFVEGYAFAESNGRTGIGGRAGGRLEFY
jgi:hypothetical protein